MADDKAVYTYVPDMIRFYLGEEPILQNVPTWQCGRPDDLAHVLANLPDAPVSLRLEAATLRGNAYRQLGNLPGCLAAMKRLEDAAQREEERLPTQASAFYSQQGRCQQELDESTLANRLYMRSLQRRW